MRSKAASGVRIPASPPFASVAQLDRVLGYEPSGRRFESSRMHHISRMVELGTKYHRVSKNYCASVAQLDSVLGYAPSGRRFESSRMHHSSLPVQRREIFRRAVKKKVFLREDNVASATARRVRRKRRIILPDAPFFKSGFISEAGKQ